MNRILIIEDEKGLQVTLEDRLLSEGFLVTVREDGISGEKEALSGNYDLILLDVMLPGRDGFQVCRNLRAAGKNTPLLMLTARGTGIDTVMGLKLGADDYLTKPFDMQVLLARIEALLRRASQKAGVGRDTSSLPIYTFGPFCLDIHQGELLKDRVPVELNSQEYRLLKFFLENPDRVLSRDELLNGVWGYDQVTTTRTVDVHVAWLRQKLEEQEFPRHILTIRGRGYKFLHGTW